MIDRNSAAPLWRQAADVVRGRIEDGTYPPGKRLPAVARLMVEVGVGETTMKKALRQLKAEGLVDSAPGFAWFVVPREGSHGAPAPEDGAP